MPFYSQHQQGPAATAYPPLKSKANLPPVDTAPFSSPNGSASEKTASSGSTDSSPPSFESPASFSSPRKADAFAGLSAASSSDKSSSLASFNSHGSVGPVDSKNHGEGMMAAVADGRRNFFSKPGRTLAASFKRGSSPVRTRLDGNSSPVRSTLLPHPPATPRRGRRVPSLSVAEAVEEEWKRKGSSVRRTVSPGRAHWEERVEGEKTGRGRGGASPDASDEETPSLQHSMTTHLRLPNWMARRPSMSEDILGSVVEPCGTGSPARNPEAVGAKAGNKSTLGAGIKEGKGTGSVQESWNALAGERDRSSRRTFKAGHVLSGRGSAGGGGEQSSKGTPAPGERARLRLFSAVSSSWAVPQSRTPDEPPQESEAAAAEKVRARMLEKVGTERSGRTKSKGPSSGTAFPGSLKEKRMTGKGDQAKDGASRHGVSEVRSRVKDKDKDKEVASKHTDDGSRGQASGDASLPAEALVVRSSSQEAPGATAWAALLQNATATRTNSNKGGARGISGRVTRTGLLSSLHLTSKHMSKREGTLNFLEDVMGAKGSPNFRAKFKLGPKLGEGAYGVVRKCSERSTGEDFACKLVTKCGLQRPLDVLKAKMEFVIQKALGKHDHIVHVEDMYEDDSFFYMVMEFCGGGDLCELLMLTGVLGEAKAGKIFTQVLNAVALCHENHVFHRDLKLENILVHKASPSGEAKLQASEAPQVKLADFGSAVLLPEGQQTSGITGGSFMYQAPEVLTGKPHDMKADMWSLGVILFSLLSGTFPFFAPSEALLLGMIKRGVYSFSAAPWKNVSDGAKDVVRLLLQPNPSLRPSASWLRQHPWVLQHAWSPDDALDGSIQED